MRPTEGWRTSCGGGFVALLAASLLLPPPAIAADPPLLRPGVFGGRVQHGVRLDLGVGFPITAWRVSYAHRGQWELSIAPRVHFLDFGSALFDAGVGSYALGWGGDVGLRVALAEAPHAALALTFGTAVDWGGWPEAADFWRTTFGPLGVAASFGGDRGVFNLAVGFVPRIVKYNGLIDVDGPLPPVAQLSAMLRLGGELRVSSRATFGLHVWVEAGGEQRSAVQGRGWTARGSAGVELMFAVATGTGG